MIISENSPFRRLRADLDCQQASFLDGIRVSAEMMDNAYCRLSDSLWRTASSFDQEKPNVAAAPLFLDAWAIVDSAHRLRQLLGAMPGLKKNTPKLQLFEKRTELTTTFRNTIQHIDSELSIKTDTPWLVWGSLNWIAVADPNTGLVHSCAVLPGRAMTATHQMINPADKTITRRIDHVTLSLRSECLSLTMVHEETEKIIRALEPSLAAHIVDQPTQAADVFLRIALQVNESSETSSAPSPVEGPTS